MIVFLILCYDKTLIANTVLPLSHLYHYLPNMTSRLKIIEGSLRIIKGEDTVNQRFQINFLFLNESAKRFQVGS